MGHYLQLTILLGASVVLHGIMWARNATFLWSRRRTILLVVGMAEAWQLITDPIGAYWGAWIINPDTVVGLWWYGLTPIEDLLGIAIVSSVAACAVLVFGYGPRRWI